MTEHPTITCPVCARTSWHLDDVREGFCGYCHDFTGARSWAGLLDHALVQDDVDAVLADAPPALTTELLGRLTGAVTVMSQVRSVWVAHDPNMVVVHQLGVILACLQRLSAALDELWARTMPEVIDDTGPKTLAVARANHERLHRGGADV